jgi:hypothetical protein
MKATNPCLDGDSLKLPSHCVNHIKNAVMRTSCENYELAVFLDRHDQLMGEIIECKGSPLSQIELPFRLWVVARDVRKNKFK